MTKSRGVGRGFGGGPKITPMEDRFWKYVVKSDKCWQWQGSKNKKGYGIFYDGAKLKLAHRISWEFEYGPIPNNLFCLHRCDTPSCVNPDHLFLGSAKANSQDMMNKGRNYQRTHPETMARGEKIGTAKLTDQECDKIKEMHATNKYFQRELGEMFGVSKACISNIITGKSRKQYAR